MTLNRRNISVGICCSSGTLLGSLLVVVGKNEVLFGNVGDRAGVVDSGFGEVASSFVVGGTFDGAQVFGTDFVYSVSDDDCLLQDLADSLKKKAFAPSSLDV